MKTAAGTHAPLGFRGGRGLSARAVVTGMLVVIAGALVPSAGAAAVPAGGPVARTSSGWVAGTAEREVAAYRGIPYAAAPVGALRWQSPRPAPRWGGVRRTTGSGPRCAQNDPARPTTILAGSGEDCLYLDVTAPRHASKRPVMVWIHGGGNTSGSGVDYDGARLASRGGAVVVTINYRLGVFGFFGHPGLAGSGTFALQDQQAALRWVRANAAAFGGDPRDVTVFGESAGAIDICGLLTSPRSAGLFDRAILESGSCLTRVPSYAGLDGSLHLNTGGFWRPVATDATAGSGLAADLGCAGKAALDCLRRASQDDLIAALARTGAAFGPAYGTAVLPTDPAVALRQGRFPRVPVLSGTNHDEARLTTMIIELLAGPVTPDRYRALLRATFGATLAAAIERRYPVPASGDAGLALSTMDTDRVFSCPQLITDRELSDRGRVYGFEFADPDAPTMTPYYSARPPGAAHTSELAYLFDLRNGGPFHGLDHADLKPAQRGLSNTMIDIWTGFARSGRAPWPTTPDVQSLAPQHVGPTDAWTSHQCDFWQAQS